jgi:hypothetical protein
MAYSDFTVYEDPSHTQGAMEGDKDGTEFLHSNLGTPLTDSTRGRKFLLTNGTTSLASQDQFFKPNSIGGVPNTKKISIRIRARMQTATAGESNTLYLIAKARGMLSSGNQNVPHGYAFSMGPGPAPASGATAGNFTLQWLSQANEGAGVTGVGNIQTFNWDSWYSMRLDVWYDAGNSRDVIECYIYEGTAATGSETWSLIHTEYITTADSRYIPWGNSQDGVAFGYFLNQPWAQGGKSAYVDDFQVFISDV